MLPYCDVMATSKHFALLIVCLVASVSAFVGAQSSTSPSGSRQSDSVLQSALEARQQGQLERAVSLFEEAASSAPENPQVRWEFGNTLYQMDRYREAAGQFQSLTAVAPRAGIGFAMLGLCEFEMKSYASAEKHFRDAATLHVSDPEIERIVEYHVALLQILDERFEAADKLLKERFVSTTGVPPQIRLALGLALLHIPVLPEDLAVAQKEVVASAGNIAVQLAVRQIDEAERGLRALLREHPDTRYLHLALARALAMEGKTTEALAELDREDAMGVSKESQALRVEVPSLASSPAHTMNAQNSGEGSAEFKTVSARALQLAQQGQFTAALEAYKQALALNPEWRDGLMSAAMMAFSTGDTKQASGFLTSLIKLDGSNGTPFALLGLCDFEAGDYDAALKHLRRGQELGLNATPQAIASANYHLGILLNRNQDFEKALPLLSGALSDAALRNDVQFAMGLNLLKLPLLPSQVTDFDRPLVAQAGEAAALCSRSHYHEAFEIFEKLIRENPQRRGIRDAYGWALFSISRFDEAEKQFEAEIALSPEDASPTLGLATVSFKAHHLDVALKAARQTVLLAPRSARAHEILGRTLLELGETATAVSELEKAVGLATDLAQAHFSLARAYSKANRPKDADRERQEFLRVSENEQTRAR